MSEGDSDAGTIGGSEGPPIRVFDALAPTMRGRVPAEAAMRRALRLADGLPPRSALARILGAHPLTAPARRAYREALAELEIAELLEQLDPQWDVLHGVPLGFSGGVIDHLVIGPGGVFALDGVKMNRRDVIGGKDGLFVGRTCHATLEAVARDAAAAERILGAVAGGQVPVTPVFVVVGARSLRLDRTSVTVLPERRLLRWLSRRPRRLSGDDVVRLSELAERADTWGSALRARGADDVRAEFDRMRRTVTAAQRRRSTWNALGFVALVAASWASVFALAAVLLTPAG